MKKFFLVLILLSSGCALYGDIPQWILEHEYKHCAGYDHDADNNWYSVPSRPAITNIQITKGPKSTWPQGCQQPGWAACSLISVPFNFCNIYVE